MPKETVKETFTPVSSLTNVDPQYLGCFSEGDGSRFYATHDNGGRPFLVQIKKDQVLIYEHSFSKGNYKPQTVPSKELTKQEIELEGQTITRYGLYYKDKHEQECMWYSLLHVIKQEERPYEVFVGLDNAASLYSRRTQQPYDPYDGGAMLIRFTTGECWFICTAVTKFVIDEKVEELYATMGNSAVVYPYIVSESKIYVFDGDVFAMPKEQVGVDPYDSFWTNSNILRSKVPTLFDSGRQIDKDTRLATTELTTL